MKSLKLIYSSAVAAIVSVIFTVAITVLGELSVPLKNWLTDFSGHHWTSKSIFSVLIYFVVWGLAYFYSGAVSAKTVRRALINLIIFSVAGILAVFLFFTAHYLNFF
ncbi:MAG: hypothetical protein HYX21_00905 [Candidatus Yanofskybacteria bacterium]|nr:hypothetical protein [Candidatus Yanofskybacteria bacterium]